jgi:iron complex outermembrane receptor protein
MKHKYKMIGQKLLLVFIMIMMTGVVFAQTGKVTGTIRDAVDGTTLPGATVKIQGTSTGTISDIDGNFSLEVEPNTTLVISYVGYETQEILVQPGTTVEIDLAMASTGLEELVVIGYGTVKKKDLTGSVVAISENDFNKGALTSPASLIQGKVSGVVVTPGGGAPGEGATIRIRGGSSLSASNDPLIVIDGIVTSGDAGSGARSALNSLNPNDIETFTVLKDASATAIYGSRASNGVIMITTKKGREGQKLKVQYTGKFSITDKPKGLDVLGTDAFTDAYMTYHAENENLLGVWYDAEGNQVAGSSANPDTDVNKRYSTDWQDEIYRSAFSMDHNVSATGAWKWLPYRFSVGYTDEQGALKTSSFNRTTLSTSLSPKFLDNHLSVQVNANASFIKNQFADQGAIGAAVQMDPTKPVKTDDGQYFYWLNNSGEASTQSTDNPVAMLEQREDKSNANRIFGNVALDYKMHFLPDLRANLNLAYDKTSNDGTVFAPNTAMFTTSGYGFGYYNEYTYENENKQLDFYLDWNKNLENIDSDLGLMGGYSYQKFYTESTFNNNTGDSTGNRTYVFNISGDDISDYVLLSYFGRLKYGFKDKYLLTAIVRADGTSRFSKDNRWGIFPSLSAAWVINNEDFLKNSKTVSQLKFRVGWGETGQQAVSGPYGYMGRYTYGNETAMYPFGNTYYTILRPEGYNPNIKWETTTTLNFGIDYGFFNDRLHGQIDYYQRKTRDLIAYVPEVLGANLTNYIDKNIGDLENNGVEFSMAGILISNEDMFLEVGGNVSYNTNEVTYLDGNTYSTGGISGGVDNNIQTIREGYSNLSFFVYEQVYDNNGNPIEGMYVDRNEDGEINSEDKYVFHDAIPDVTYGLNLNFTYKDWALNMAGHGSFDNWVYNNAASEIGTYQRLYRSEGPYASNVAASVLNTAFVGTQYNSDYYVQQASFFRMDEITMSYTFRDISKYKFNLTLNATVNNAFVITPYEGSDPEVYGGIDNNLYPRSRVWTLGLNLKF